MMSIRLPVYALVLLLLFTGFGISAFVPEDVAAGQNDSNTSVNIELILDVSGSMAQVIDTGETRMEAAKRVIRDVISAVPDQDGINVGLRVYGFAGDNTEGGRAESCESSDLVVDIDGVDREAILDQVDQLQPTGWTPLALSLERAGEDFSAGDDVTNAAVLITDGLETCDGDPCEVASSLNSDDINLITHVVGFGVTAEEQATLGCIADGGEGLLLGAGNAGELSAALFTVLQNLDVVQGEEFIGGTAFGLLPQGEEGELSVVAVGTYDGNFLPIVARNNTGSDISRITAVATARNSTGQVIGSGNDQLFNPNLVRIGGLSFGYAYFGGIDLPEDATFDVQLDSEIAADAEYENRRDLQVDEASTLEGRVTGMVSNIYENEIGGPISSAAVCFDADGTLLSYQQSFSSIESVDPGQSISFQADNFLQDDCPLFLVAASGFDNTFGPNNSIEPPGAPLVTEGDSEPAPRATPVSREATPQTSNEGGASDATPTADTANDACTDLTSAEDVLLALRDLGLPIGEYEVYTAETDANELLGRPGQYIGKVNFTDTTVVAEPSIYDVQEGGAIEVFDSEADAERRRDYVEQVTQAVPAFVEYEFLEGTVLLRLSQSLTPDKAEVYHQALIEVVTCGEVS